MTKRIYTDPSIASSEITPEAVFLNRRNLIKSAAAGVASATALDVAADEGQSADTPLSFSPQTRTNHWPPSRRPMTRSPATTIFTSSARTNQTPPDMPTP